MGDVYDERDRILLAEAKLCREAEAFRAAFILTWIAVAEGLRWRFNDMSLRDDEMAKWVAETDRLEASGKTIDQRLLDRAKAAGMVTDPEFKKLTYLKDMRNSFAHPTGAAPTAVEADGALQVAIDVVLSRPPLLGYGFAKERVEALFTDLHFLDDVQEKVAAYADYLRPMLQPNIAPWMVEKVVGRLSGILDDPQLVVYARRAQWFAQQFLMMAEDVGADRWRIEQMLDSYPAAAALVAGNVQIFKFLDTRVKDMVFGRLAEPAPAGQVLPPSATTMGLLWALHDDGLLDDRQQRRLTTAAARVPYTTLQQSVPFQAWAHKVITDLDTHNWYIQNPAALALAAVGPQAIRSADEQVQELLGRGLLAASDGTAADAEELLAQLSRRDGENWPPRFIEGLLLETVVNDDGSFRLKPKLLPKVAGIVADHPDSAEMVRRVVEAIHDAGERDPRMMWWGHEQLKDIQSSGGQHVLDAVSDAVCAFVDDEVAPMTGSETPEAR